MAEQTEAEQRFGDDIDFPMIPKDENPEDSHALTLIMAGQRGCGAVYEAIEKKVAGDARVLVRMLRRDWERRFPALLSEGKVFLAMLAGVKQDEIEAVKGLPSETGIQKVVASVNGSKPHELTEFLEDVAEMTLVCQRLLPWKSDTGAGFDYFGRCVDAEGQHLHLILQFQDLSSDR